MPDDSELKGLQIKAELNKLGEPSQSYARHLKEMCVNPNASSFGDSGRILLADRFRQIQGARPASSPYAQGAAQGRTEEQKQARREKLAALREKKQKRPAAGDDVEMQESQPASSNMNDNIRARLYAKDDQEL